MVRLLSAVFISGGALMSLEIVGSRVLAPFFGSSIFVWGALISTFLAALAIGYAFGGRLADRRPEPRLLSDLLVLAAVLVWLLFLRPEPMLELFAATPIPERFRALLAAVALFGLPSVLMGAVTPFAVRLLARGIGSIGSDAGLLSAVSTAGSILGTFLTAFFFIPAFTTRTVLGGIGASLVLAAMLLPGALDRFRLVRNLVLLAGAFLGYGPAVVPTPPEASVTVLLDKETAYHHLRVVERRSGARSLFFDRANQGYISRGPGGVWDVPHFTNGLVFSLAFRRTLPRSVVLIGLGPGLLPRILSKGAPEIQTTAIEIDPVVEEIARQYFDFKLDANDRVLIGDGRRLLRLEPTQTDAVLVDAFFSDTVPFHLTTKEFYQLCFEKLSPDGVFAANFISQSTGPGNRLLWASIKSLRSVFPQVYVFGGMRPDRKTFASTVIVVGVKSKERLDAGMIQERATELAARLQCPPIAVWPTMLYEGPTLAPDAPLLTDQYSPTDALQHFGK